jgi:hypothetical protein
MFGANISMSYRWFNGFANAGLLDSNFSPKKKALIGW